MELGYEDERRALGARLRRARLAAGLSQQELAGRTGIHRLYIGGVERGERNPSVSVVHALADGLGIKVVELFREDD